MKLKSWSLLAALASLLLAAPSAHSMLESCYEEECTVDTSSASFFMEELNDMEDIDDLAALPTSGQFWPVEGIITGRYGKWRGRKRGHVHVGVDIAAPYGSPIVSPLSGVVSFVGRKGGYGLTLIIDHGDGISTLYGHNKEVTVAEGDLIDKGQLVSKIGMSGRSTGPHVHYEVRLDGRPVNPLAWTQKLQAQRL